MSEKLEICPFCKYEGDKFIPFICVTTKHFEGMNGHEEIFNVECDNCGASTSPTRDRGQAIELWNQRTP